MNFGNWIVVAFVLFALFIATLVTVCMRQDINLVSKEYYKDELAYQDQIERIQNTRDLKEKPVIKRINSSTLQLRFNLEAKIQKGELILFSPSNPDLDKSFNLELSHTNTQFINIDSIQKGMYRVKLSWSAAGKQYFHEEVICI